MISHLIGIENWQTALRPDGTPVWLAAAKARPELLENFLARKRVRPDFTQRDSDGRSAWYALTSLQEGAMKTVRALLEKELPLINYGRDTQGRGLFVQVMDTAGGLPSLLYPKVGLNDRARIKNVFRLLEVDEGQLSTEDKIAVLDGVERIDFRQLDTMPIADARMVAARLFTSHALVSHLEPETAVDVGLFALHLQLRDENSSAPSLRNVNPIIDNIKWVIATHGSYYPDKMQQWSEAIDGMDAISGLQLGDVTDMKRALQAMLSKSLLEAGSNTATQDSRGAAKPRF